MFEDKGDVPVDAYTNSETKKSNEILDMILKRFDNQYEMEIGSDVGDVKEYFTSKMTLNSCYALFDTEFVGNDSLYCPKSIIITQKKAIGPIVLSGQIGKHF